MTTATEVKTNPSPAVIDKTTPRELTPSISPSFSFPIGYYQLHPDISINFQLNRFYGWAGDDSMLTEMRDAVAGVNDYPMFTKIILDLGEKALARHEVLERGLLSASRRVLLAYQRPAQAAHTPALRRSAP